MLMRVLVSTRKKKKERKSLECTSNSFMRRDVFLMRALSISRLMGFVKVLPMAPSGWRAFCSSRITLGYERCRAMRQIPPPRTIRKWESWRWCCPPLQRRPSGPTGGLAPPRPRGTAAGTDVKPGDERRRADCFLLLKHCMVGRGGAVAASNKGKKSWRRRREAVSSLRRDQRPAGTSWKGPQWCQSREIIWPLRVGVFLLLTTLPAETRGGEQRVRAAASRWAEYQPGSPPRAAAPLWSACWRCSVGTRRWIIDNRALIASAALTWTLMRPRLRRFSFKNVMFIGTCDFQAVISRLIWAREKTRKQNWRMNNRFCQAACVEVSSVNEGI